MYSNIILKNNKNFNNIHYYWSYYWSTRYILNIFFYFSLVFFVKIKFVGNVQKMLLLCYWQCLFDILMWRCEDKCRSTIWIILGGYKVTLGFFIPPNFRGTNTLVIIRADSSIRCFISCELPDITTDEVEAEWKEPGTFNSNLFGKIQCLKLKVWMLTFSFQWEQRRHLQHMKVKAACNKCF